MKETAIELFNALIPLNELSKIIPELNYKENKAIIAAVKILNICAKNKKFNVTVSMSSENEILIYSKNSNQYRNLLIDSDGDIHFILIGKKLGEEKSKVFFQEDNLDYAMIASLI